MSREILDTSSNYPGKDIPDGPHTFKVGIVSKKDIKGNPGYEWNLEENGVDYQLLMWPNGMGPLLRVLHVKEDPPNKFMFDTMEVEGLKFKCNAYKDKKNYQALRDYSAVVETKEDLPF